MPSPSVLNALSFDVEDWFHLLDIQSVENPTHWRSLPSLVERYTDLILGILDEVKVSATFFAVGWIAEKYPNLVPRIAGTVRRRLETIGRCAATAIRPKGAGLSRSRLFRHA
jgi:hypothetical protein